MSHLGKDLLSCYYYYPPPTLAFIIIIHLLLVNDYDDLSDLITKLAWKLSREVVEFVL